MSIASIYSSGIRLPIDVVYENENGHDVFIVDLRGIDPTERDKAIVLIEDIKRDSNITIRYKKD